MASNARVVCLVVVVLQAFARWPGAESADCDIPVGKFDGMIFDINTEEPYYGSRCVNRSGTLVQIRKWQCMPYFCCDKACSCNNTSSLFTQYRKCSNNTNPQSLSCYVVNSDEETDVYSCCPGFEEDEFRVCTKAIDCSVNNGGCDPGLCQHNATTGKDFCACEPGYTRQLVNSLGATQCIGNGPLPTTPTTSTLTPAAAVVYSGFPVPYIIAIAVGLFLLLLILLLLLLLLLCCRKRRKEEEKPAPTVFIVDTLEKKLPIDDDYDDLKKVKVIDDDLDTRPGKPHRNENDYSEDPVANRARVSGMVEGMDDRGTMKEDAYLNPTAEDDGIYAEIEEKDGSQDPYVNA